MTDQTHDLKSPESREPAETSEPMEASETTANSEITTNPEIPEADGISETTEAVDTEKAAPLDDSATEESDDDVADDDAPAGRPRPKRDVWHFTRKPKFFPVMLVVLLAISVLLAIPGGGGAAWMYYNWYRPDQQTDPNVARAAVTAASDGTVALLSYAPDTLDKDFASARSHLAGDFLSYYNTFTEQIVAPAAKQKSLKTTAHVMRAAVSELHDNSAVVLVFVDQSTTSKDTPDPALAASSVLVTMAKVDGKWLITKFTPV